MTPNEKANQLIQMMQGQFPNPDMSFTMAKSKAILCVSELEDAEYNVLMTFQFVRDGYKSEYWKEVKAEINKM